MANPKPEHRFGISLLSKSRFKKAYLEEVLIDKNTGEILVRTPEGDVVSFDYSSRRDYKIDEFRSKANHMGIYGDYYEIMFNMDNENTPNDDTDDEYTSLPMMVDVNVEYIDASSPVVLDLASTRNTKKFKRFSLYLDLPLYPYTYSAEDDSLISFTNYGYIPKVTLTMQCVFDDNRTKSFEISDFVDNINGNIFNLSTYLTDTELTKDINELKIINFKINNSYRDSFGTTGRGTGRNPIKAVLYNFFILFENY